MRCLQHCSVSLLLVVCASAGWLMFAGGCGGGSSAGAAPTQAPIGDLLEELEPNDTPAGAGALNPVFDTAWGAGALGDASDVDWWKLDLGAGETIAIEVFATRFGPGFGSWGDNAPRLTLYDPTGSTEILDQWASGGGTIAPLGLGRLSDMDLPCFAPETAGTYLLRIQADNATGGSGPYVLRVGPPGGIPIVGTPLTETEAAGVTGVNDDPSTAQALGFDDMLRGHGDGAAGSDFYSLNIAEPSFLSIALMARRAGRWHGALNYDAPVLRIHSSLPSPVAMSQPVLMGDPLLTYGILTPGTYYVEVAGVALGAPYELSGLTPVPFTSTAETEPANDTRATAQLLGQQLQNGTIGVLGDVDWYRFIASGPEMIFVHLLSQAGLEGSSGDVPIVAEVAAGGALPLHAVGSTGTYRAILPAAGTYYLKVGGGTTPAGTTYALDWAGNLSGDPEIEPNDPGGATPTPLTSVMIGNLPVDTDADVYSIVLHKNEVVMLHVLATPAGNDPTLGWSGWTGGTDNLGLAVRDAAGLVVAGTFQDMGTDPLPVGIAALEDSLGMMFLAPEAGTYTIEIGPTAAGQMGTYVLWRD